MTFDEYKIALLDFYKAQKDSDKLSTELAYPNRTKLKQEFLKKYRAQNSLIDTGIIVAFFDPDGKSEDPLDSIEKFELDKLRPLINFLTNGTILQADAPVHALAWLFGFPPYAEWRLASDPIDPPIIFPPVIDPPVIDDEKHDDKEVIPPTITPSQKHILIGIAVVLLCIGLIAAQQLYTQMKPYHPSPTEKCMYWNGHQYVPTLCDINSNDKAMFPLDLRALNRQRKIRWPDLLTKREIGKVWYIRIDGHHEFFTDSGSYPLDPQKRLRPLTAYILSNHVSYYRFILQTLIWSIAVILLLVLVYLRIKKALHKGTARIKKVSGPKEFTQAPQNLHSLS